MGTPTVFESEYRFCCILWAHEPISSGELVQRCADELGWKKSTTFTVIRRLAERGVLRSENAVVTSLVSQEEVQRHESRDFLDRTFGGSLPQFVAAFTGDGSLSAEEAAQIRRLIEQYEEGLR